MIMKIHSFGISLLMMAFATLCLMSCRENTEVKTYQIGKPTITTFSPTEGEVGTEITIEGDNLTNIDTVLIGDAPAIIRYRVSEHKLIAKVQSGNQSGKITVRNTAGSFTTDELFTVQYKQPVVDEYPTIATVYDQVVITGQNLHFITAVFLADNMTTIVAQRPTELVFTVPFYDSEEPVTLRFAYFNGTEDVKFGPEGATFLIEKQKPSVNLCPDSVEKYSPVQIMGEHLDLVEALYVGTLRMDIRLQNESMIEFDVPSNYFDGPFVDTLKAIFYGTKSMAFHDDFRVVSDPNEPRYNKYSNVTLSARVGSGGTEMAFFDADLGLVISSCEAEDNMQAIDFFLYDNSGYAQLYSPSNATNTAKNFKCDGTSITAANPTAWNEFYKTECLFRVLNPDNATQKAVIDAYEAGTIVKLDEEFFAGITPPSGKAPRVYQTDEDRNAGGTSHFSANSYAWGWVLNTTTGKNGIIKILGTKASAETGKTYEVSFDIIWEK